MVVISLTLTASTAQIVSGIPNTVSVAANLPSTIFYTLDGTDPTVASTIYTGPIALNTNKGLSVELKVFATDGINSSPIISQVYQTDILGQDARLSHSGTDAQPNSTQTFQNPAPFGTPPIQPGQHFLGPQEAGLNAFDPALPPGPPTGFDGAGNPIGFTNDQFIGIPSKAFPVKFSDRDAEGQAAQGGGNLPPHTVKPTTPPPEISNVNSKLFDPRALVIIQDLTQPQDPERPPIINRPSFTLEDVQHTRTGNQFFNVGPDSPPPTTTFTRQQYNPRTNTYTFSYFDSTQNRWIFSTTPYVPPPAITNYAEGLVFRKGSAGAKFVYQWVVWKPQFLY